MGLRLILALLLVLPACHHTSRDAPQVTRARADAPPATAALVDPAHIDAVLRELVDSGQLVGVSALIWEQDREVYFGAFGHADREAGRPMARDTLVQIYSMTKPVTGAVLMSLYDEGRFALHDPLATHLPEYSGMQVFVGDDDAGRPRYAAPRRPILVYDILRHTAGFAADTDTTSLGRHVAAANFGDRGRSLAQLSELVAQLPLAFQPGTRWLYGVSVDVQARLAERLAGKPFAQLLHERILDPLQMHDTGYHVPHHQRTRMAAMYRIEHGDLVRVPDAQAFEGIYREWPLSPGGYGLTSTLDDYMRFGRMLLGDGALDGVRILAPGTVPLMATDALPPEVTERSWLPSKGQVGFGIDFAVRHSPPADADESSGAVGEFFWDGYANTLFWVDPKHRLVAVLFTQYVPPGGTDLHKRFRDAVYRRDPAASSAGRRAASP